MNLFYLFKRYILDRDQEKRSVKYPFLQASTSLGTSIFVFIFFWFLSKDSIVEINTNAQTIIALSVCFISIYLRAFIKLYNKKLKILTA